MENLDEFFEQAVDLILNKKIAATSIIQKHFGLGYTRAARIMDQLESEGVIGPSRGAEPREILISKYEKVKPKDGAVDKSVWNTEVYKEMVVKHGEQKGDLSDAERDKIAKILALPDMTPYDVDGTLEAWLLRISLWGQISIKHNNPDVSIKDKSISNADFLNYIADQERNASFGIWAIETPALDCVKFTRSFDSIYGNDVTEELIVSVDLRPDIKQALKSARNE